MNEEAIIKLSDGDIGTFDEAVDDALVITQNDIIDDEDADEIGVEVLGISDEVDENGMPVEVAFLSDDDEVAVIVEDIHDDYDEYVAVTEVDSVYPDDGEVIDISEQPEIIEIFDEPYLAMDDDMIPADDDMVSYLSDDFVDYGSDVEIYEL